MVARSAGGVVEGVFLCFDLLLFVRATFTTSDLFIEGPRVPVLVSQASGVLIRVHMRTRGKSMLGGLSLRFGRKVSLGSVGTLHFFCDKARTASQRKGRCHPISCVSDRTRNGAGTTGPTCSVGRDRMASVAGIIAFADGRPVIRKIGCC